MFEMYGKSVGLLEFPTRSEELIIEAKSWCYFKGKYSESSSKTDNMNNHTEEFFKFLDVDKISDPSVSCLSLLWGQNCIKPYIFTNQTPSSEVLAVFSKLSSMTKNLV